MRNSINPTKGFSLVEILVVLSLMALMVILLGSKLNTSDKKNWRVYKTCQIMEEIREAIIGRPGLYCNGIRQFTGYVSDMGAWPGLFDKRGNKIDSEEIGDVLQRKLTAQPRALWTRDINNDGDYEDQHDISEEWGYDVGAKIWAGWRGPYIDPPPDGILKDAWGNPLIFIMGELTAYGGKTYRCLKTHKSTVAEPHPPGDEEYWQELKDSDNNPIYITANPWFDPRRLLQEAKRINHREGEMVDVFYDDALVIISYGEDGRPGGKGLDKDLIITIYREEWTGEVAGHVGYKGNLYVDSVTLYYPDFNWGGIDQKTIGIHDIDHDSCGINFRFGTSDMIGNCIEFKDDICRKYEIIHEPGPDSNWAKVDVPAGIRSIKAGGKTYIFPVEASGNWIGTIK